MAATALGALLLAQQPAAFGAAVPGPAAQATAVSPQPTPSSPQPPPVWRPIQFYPVAPPFMAYYTQVEGFRVMGRAISPLGTPTGLPSQYFEKARLEDHTATETIPEWQYQYGLLVDELIAVRSLAPLGGDRSTVTYNTVALASEPEDRVPPPAGAVSDAIPGG
ncbi:MAG: hypothetical protein ACRDI2_09335, partial [Chloroflexota bacterium]